MKKLKGLRNRLMREHLGHLGHLSLDLVQIELEIESDMDTLVYIVSQVSGL